MRWCLVLTLLLPSAAYAQAAADPPGELASPVDTALVSTAAPWVLDDGQGAQPWERDTRRRLPGQFYFAWVFRGGAMLGNPARETEGPTFELSGLFDFRHREGGAWHLRVGIAVLARTFREVATADEDATSPGALALRVLPLVVDLTPHLSLRAGGDIGLQWVEEKVGWLVNVSGEAAGRFPGTRIEIGVYGGMTVPDAVGRSSVSRLQAMFGALVGGVL
ncbi:MAG: hypothetical protein AB8I08_13400 [Sandaracinaceae bacterium]